MKHILAVDLFHEKLLVFVFLELQIEGLVGSEFVKVIRQILV